MLPKILTDIPGPRSLALATRLKRVESRNVTFCTPDFPVFWERAEGVNVWDVDGNRYLDLTSGFAVAGLGYGRAELVAALQDQAGKLIHAMGDVHPTELKVRLCEILSEITFERWGVGGGKTLLTNSGSEAVEAALKTAFLATGKRGVIAFHGAYHGLGYGAVETAGLPFFRDPFREQLGDFCELVEYPECAACPFGEKDGVAADEVGFPRCKVCCMGKIEEQLRAILSKNGTGCILVEPAQGRAGEVVPPREFLPMLRRLCDEFGVLLVLDEIYTGFNRTGRLFACEHTGTVPDLMCLGKGLTSGFPLSACVGRASVMDAWPETQGEALHTSTFLGNPLGCRMALESVRLHLLPETLERVQAVVKRLREGLNGLEGKHCRKTHGIGLMLGLEIMNDAGGPDPARMGGVILAGLKDGLILLGGGRRGNVLSLTPPFDLSQAEVDYLVERLRMYLA